MICCPGLVFASTKLVKENESENILYNSTIIILTNN